MICISQFSCLAVYHVVLSCCCCSIYLVFCLCRFASCEKLTTLACSLTLMIHISLCLCHAVYVCCAAVFIFFHSLIVLISGANLRVMKKENRSLAHCCSCFASAYACVMLSKCPVLMCSFLFTSS